MYVKLFNHYAPVDKQHRCICGAHVFNQITGFLCTSDTH